MMNSLGSLLLLSLLLEIWTLSILATDSCPGSCDPGQQPSKYCTNPLLCYTCPQQMFSNRNLRFGEKCRERTTCLKDNMITVDEGDVTHDATCGCVEGYELSKYVHACIKKSVEKTTTDLAVNTNTTDQTPVPSTNKTSIALAIVLPVSILSLVLILGLLYSYKIRLKCKGRKKGLDSTGLQGNSHVADDKTKRVIELPEVPETSNNKMLDGDPRSNGSHEGTPLVKESGHDGEENSSGTSTTPKTKNGSSASAAVGDTQH